MKTQRSILNIFCILVLLGCSSLNAAERKEYSNTLLASAFIRIEANTCFLWIGEENQLEALCRPAIQQALREVYKNHDIGDLSESLVSDIEFFGRFEGPANEKAIQFVININLEILNEDFPKAAEEVKETFLKILKNNLARAYEDYYKSRKNRETVFATQVAEAEAQMSELQQVLLGITGGKKMSREFLEDQITKLSEEIQKAEFEIQVRNNRLGFLRRQREEAEVILQDRQANDPITVELQKKINLLEQNLQRIKKIAEAGQITGQDIQEVEQHLIEARIELAQHREMAGESPEARRIQEIKGELADLTLEQSEQEMHINFLQEQIHEARQLLERSTEFESLRIKSEVLRDSLYESMEQLEEIRRENGLLTPPTVTVISQ